jgi:hypothetical protein
MSDAAMANRTTVTIADEPYSILEKWADRDVRSIANLIEAIVVSQLRGKPLPIPPDLYSTEKAVTTVKNK